MPSPGLTSPLSPERAKALEIAETCGLGLHENIDKLAAAIEALLIEQRAAVLEELEVLRNLAGAWENCGPNHMATQHFHEQWKALKTQGRDA